MSMCSRGIASYIQRNFKLVVGHQWRHS